MILGIQKELSIFLQALLAGNLLYLIYRVLYLLRKLIRHSNFWISVEDVVYWMFAGIYVFLGMQKTCNGNIRWYFVVGLLGGSLVTCFFIRKIVRKHIDKTDKTE